MINCKWRKARLSGFAKTHQDNGAIGGVIFGTITDYPAPYEIAICNYCKWQGNPNELLSYTWEDFRYCPVCGSDDTEIKDMVYDDTINEYKVE